jgi:peptide/nickel transport system permease protein
MSDLSAALPPPGPLEPAARAGDQVILSARPSSLWRDTLANVLRQRSAIVGLIILGSLVLMAVFAGQIATHDPNEVLLGVEPGVEKRAGPCIHLLGCPEDQPQHLFGTDGNFRDVFSRVVYGARTSLSIGLAAIAFAIIVGGAIGAVAGFIGGWLDNTAMRVMVYARIVRASVLSAREADYVTASRALGESNLGILTRRILPNSITPLVVQGTLGIGGAVLEIAALTFVGVTGALSQAEWGSMIGLERNQLFSAPHIILVPGLAITLTVLGFNLLGDGLRDALDPRLNR